MKGDKIERYFVNQESIERYARELEHLEHISSIAADDVIARHDAPQRATARNDAPRRDEPAVIEPKSDSDPEGAMLKNRVNTLEKENFQLAIDRAAKETVINQMIEERREWVNRLTEQGREIGRLEMQVQQLAAPKDATARHDASDIDQPVTVRIVPPSPPPEIEAESTQAEPPSAPKPPKQSVWQKMFS